jgi:DNA-binding MarR family transcriptional regulator
VPNESHPHQNSVKAGQSGVGFMLNQASRALNAEMAPVVANYGLDLSMYTVIRHLLREMAEMPDGVPPAVLSRKLNMPLVAVEDAASRLERDGWIERAAAEGGIVLCPTRKARAAEPVLVDASRWLLERTLNGFSREEIEQFTVFMRRVLDNLGAPQGEDEGPLGL